MVPPPYLPGEVKSWKPMLDPDTRKSKGFGFCEFVGAEGVLAALKLLNGLEVDGQALLLKVNEATQEYLNHFQSEKRTSRAGAEEEGEAPGKTPEPTEEEAAAEERARAAIKVSLSCGRRGPTGI